MGRILLFGVLAAELEPQRVAPQSEVQRRAELLRSGEKPSVPDLVRELAQPKEPREDAHRAAQTLPGPRWAPVTMLEARQEQPDSDLHRAAQLLRGELSRAW